MRSCLTDALIQRPPPDAYYSIPVYVRRADANLRLERRLIRRAKAYARRTGKSVSELVAYFFGRLEAPAEAGRTDVVAQSPAVQSLVGALAGAG
jgi:hypothetical protein